MELVWATEDFVIAGQPYAGFTLVVDGLVQQNFPQLRPMLITEQ
ncbi:hypothetical protein [Pseudomonas gessardii]